MKHHTIIKGVEHKQCARCGQLLPLRMFANDNRIWDGLHHFCRVCESEYRRMKRQRAKEKFVLIDGIPHKKCTKCGRMLPAENYHKHSSSLDGLQTHCKDCRKEKEMLKEEPPRKPAKKIEKVAAAKRLLRASDDERCGSCKSWSPCHGGSGFCMKLKTSAYRHNVCADYTPKYERTFAQECTQIRFTRNTPYD